MSNNSDKNSFKANLQKDRVGSKSEDDRQVSNHENSNSRKSSIKRSENNEDERNNQLNLNDVKSD